MGSIVCVRGDGQRWGGGVGVGGVGWRQSEGWMNSRASLGDVCCDGGCGAKLVLAAGLAVMPGNATTHRDPRCSRSCGCLMKSDCRCCDHIMEGTRGAVLVCLDTPARSSRLMRGRLLLSLACNTAQPWHAQHLVTGQCIHLQSLLEWQNYRSKYCSALDPTKVAQPLDTMTVEQPQVGCLEMQLPYSQPLCIVIIRYFAGGAQ